ncbi:hypothetical protein ACOME3_000609 [Neoechinorhynchus agilis]
MLISRFVPFLFVSKEIDSISETSYTDYESSASRTLSDSTTTTTTNQPSQRHRPVHRRTLSQNRARRRPHRRRHARIPSCQPPRMRPSFEKAMSILSSSTCSDASSTLSLSIVTVTLDLARSRFLGISVVSDNERMFRAGGTDFHGGRMTEGGVYIGSVIKGGLVEQDGRIEIGDMILQVNEHSLEDITNNEAIRIIRRVVETQRYIKLVVAKRWDAIPRERIRYDDIQGFTRRPVQPIDPGLWAARQAKLSHQRKIQDVDDSRSSVVSDTSTFDISTVVHDDDQDNDATLTEDYSNGDQSHFGPFFSGSSQSDLNEQSSCSILNLTASSDMESVCRAMLAIDSGLDIRDRMWLKVRIPNGFLGSDLVDWLHRNVRLRFSTFIISL